MCKINVLCKYADDLTKLCPQQASTDLGEEFSQIVRWHKLVSYHK